MHVVTLHRQERDLALHVEELRTTVTDHDLRVQFRVPDPGHLRDNERSLGELRESLPQKKRLSGGDSSSERRQSRGKDRKLHIKEGFTM